MKLTSLFNAVILLASLTAVAAHPQRSQGSAKPKKNKIKNGNIRNNGQEIVPAQAPGIPLKPVKIGALTIFSNTTSGDVAAVPKKPSSLNSRAVAETAVKSTVLILARDTASAYSAWSGLNGYAIPYQVVIVPQAGVTLPALFTGTEGNYGAIVVLSEVSYDYGGTIGFSSALTTAQWTSLYEYQIDFGVRMVRLDVFPGPAFGTTALGGCCDAGTDQLISISSATQFPTAGLKTGQGVSTSGLWHYPSSITDATIATEFAQFGPAGTFTSPSTAGVINNITGRQQMVFFISWATNWAQASNHLQHAWIHWATRGLYTGFRRINLSTQVDDMFLESDIYSPAGTTYQLTTADLTQHRTWQTALNAKLPAGSDYFLEIAHNGNGNIEAAAEVATGTQCGIGPIQIPEQIDTPLEWMKPLGTGTSLWPSTPATYPYTTTCTNLDALKNWFATTSNRNSFAHLSHTFTHEDQNNATYFDVSREIVWNKAWLTQVGIAGAPKFSPAGLVPPAITGLRNGDALQAWWDNGITNAVGDNTRPGLLNTQNEHWPLTTTLSANGFNGMLIVPRWATNIYYNCHLPACTVLEWINTSAGSGDWYTLLNLEKNTNTRHLFGLRRDPYMFHQANLNYQTAGNTIINGVSAKLSLIEAWVETVAQEMVRLTSWPIRSLKQDDIAGVFIARVKRDNCAPKLKWTTNATARTITGVTLTTNGNNCDTKIPVTFPGTVTSNQGFTTEKLGSDPLTIWVTMSGAPVTFTLTTPIPY